MTLPIIPSSPAVTTCAITFINQQKYHQEVLCEAFLNDLQNPHLPGVPSISLVHYACLVIVCWH
eukprot:2295544-Ditylum_brightwellii.AAC.1